MGPGSIAASVRSMRSVLSGRANADAGVQQLDGSSSHHTATATDTSDNDSDSDDSSSSEDEEESVFVYTRVSRLPPTFFRKDAVSACRITSDIHVYGTHSGIVHICQPDSTPIRTVRLHRSSVLDITSSNEGAFVATASIDGTVVISAVSDASDLAQASFRRPVHAIALHPDYRSHRSYVSGGTAGQVVLSERGWLKSRADTVLAQTQSTILALAWPTPARLLWCNEDGITTYDPESRVVLHRVSRRPHSPRADLFRPRIHVGNDSMACVAWHKTIFVINLQTGLLAFAVDCDSTLAGAVPFHGMQQFTILAVDTPLPGATTPKQLQNTSEGRRDSTASRSSSVAGSGGIAELKLVDASTGHETYADELELNDGARLGVNDYHLALGAPTKVWIVSSADAVIARERTPRDHVDWLLERHKYTEAYSAASNHKEEVGADTAELKQLGLKAAQQLADLGKWDAAARLLAGVLHDDRAEWLLWSNQFLSAGHPLVWGDVLPSNIELNGVHDAVLDAAVDRCDTSRLTLWIREWPLSVFDGAKLAQRLESVTRSAGGGGGSASARPLLEVLGRLWLKLDEYVKAVQVFVSANSSQAFAVASHYHLWTEPQIEKLLGAVLSAGDGEDGSYVERLRELINCRAEISPSRVVRQLELDADAEGQDLLLFGYLTELGLVDETMLGEFADRLIQLYAKYDPAKLLGFLERFDTYDIDATIALCRANHLDRELVYLLGRVGKPLEALEIMVSKLQDYEAAVSFARTQGLEVWDQLIAYSSTHPGLVLALLKCVEVSPARVLAMVPESMRIPGLKQALCKVLNNQEVSLELSEGALEIVRSESRRWTHMLRTLRLKGFELENADGWDAANDAVLISESGGIEKVPPPQDGQEITTFSQKIKHLRWILGL